MRVILLQDIVHLGEKGNIKDVSDGYARNFLIPRGLAKPASESALKVLAAQKVREEREKSEEYQKYKALVDKLSTLVLQFKVKMGEKGRAFGSITAAKIRDALKKQGVSIEKEWVLLESPIKSTGEKLVKIKFPQGLGGEVKVVIESE